MSYVLDINAEVPPALAAILAQLAQGLKDLYGDRFRGLLLYGSYARGEAAEGSDVDLLLLLAGPVDPMGELLRMEAVTWPLSLDSSLVLSVLPVSFDEYRAGNDNFFLNNVRRDAIAAA